MNDILIRLQSLGISPAESEVYLALIKLGTTKAGQIISLVKISSSNVHEALEKLVKKGLVSYILKNGIKEFSAANPETLNLLIDKDKKELEEREMNLKKLLIEIKSIQPASIIDQNAEIYSGYNGIKSAFTKLLESENKEEFLFFYKYDNNEKVHEFFSKMDKEEYYSKLKTRAIFSTEYKKLFKKRKNKIKVKFTDQPIPSSINIHKNRVLIISWNEKPVGFLIESLEISQMFKELFESTWIIAQR